jgi:hypothetical protein
MTAPGPRATSAQRRWSAIATKRGELAPPASSPRFVVQLSLLFARDSLATRLSERVEYRAIKN